MSFVFSFFLFLVCCFLEWWVMSWNFFQSCLPLIILPCGTCSNFIMHFCFYYSYFLSCVIKPVSSLTSCKVWTNVLLGFPLKTVRQTYLLLKLGLWMKTWESSPKGPMLSIWRGDFPFSGSPGPGSFGDTLTALKESVLAMGKNWDSEDRPLSPAWTFCLPLLRVTTVRYLSET